MKINLEYEKILKGLPRRTAPLPADSPKEKLVLGYMRDAFFCLMHRSGYRLDPREIYSLCYAGLSDAARNFDPSKGGFWDYAERFLAGDLANYWKELDPVPGAYRKNGNQPVSWEDYTEALKFETVDPEWDLIDLHDKMDLLSSSISRLTPVQQGVIYFLLDGRLSASEISQQMGISRGGVNQILTRAIQNLRAIREKNLK